MSGNIGHFHNTCKGNSLTLVVRFLLVSLSINAILGEVTIYKRRKMLEEVIEGKGLGDAYTPTLTRIRSQGGRKSKLGMEALMWISHSERPLKALELCQALGVEQGDTDQNAGNIPVIETVLRCSLGLITIEPSSTVRLVHFTLQDRLSNDSSLFCSPHSMMAEVCLTFLNFQLVKGLSTALCSPPVAAPFVGYASCYWGAHARKELSQRVKLLALKLLDGYDKHISSKLLLIHKRPQWQQRRPKREGGNALEGFTALHGAACLGIVEIACTLLETREWDFNATDFAGYTAFAWAAREGYEGMVKMLLERADVNPNWVDEHGVTPLFGAAWGGHEGVVKVLLERNDVSPDIADEHGQTPLFVAAQKGHEGVVKMLLERNDVSPNTADAYGQTPLFIAAEKGHERVVKMLLEHANISPNTAKKRGPTPLWIAAFKGHDGVVRMMLERNDVNPNTAGKYRQTPLFIAAREGHERVVEMLLKRRDVKPNTTNKWGQMPLFIAAQKGHEGVVGMLLERNDVNLNTANKYGQTPLFIATKRRHEGVVRMLLERMDVNSDMKDLAGETALSQALNPGHDAIVKLLFEHRNFIPLLNGDELTKFSSPEPPDPDQRPSKRIRKF